MGSMVSMAAVALMAHGATDNVAEEVVWMIGDQPIWKSEVEEAYQQMQQERHNIIGDPYCYVPEQIAMERLFLHQADLDTIEVSAGMVASEVDARINDWIVSAGSRERLEEMIHKPLPEIRSWMTEMMTNNYRVQQVQQKLTKDINVTPAAVRRYFNTLETDSIPFVPMQVEVQIMTLNPVIPRQEIDDIKDRLRGYADRINSGQAEMSTLAVLYSEDPGSARRGGETGFLSRTQLDPEYAAAAFALNDPRKVSKVVESEYGYHIIQLIEKRGDRINTRHILLHPKVDDKDLMASVARLDSIRADMLDGHFTFEEATALLSQDKDTRNNRGVMMNSNNGTTLFEMGELPQEVGKTVATMQPGDISPAFIMKDPRRSQDVVAVVKLTARHEPHRANMADDYQLIKNMYEASERQRIISDWVTKKISETYIRIEDGWNNCEFRYNWLKNKNAAKE